MHVTQCALAGADIATVPFKVLEQMTLGALRKAVVEGDVMYGSVMAGQSAALVKKEETCAEIIRDVMSGAEKLLGQK